MTNSLFDTTSLDSAVAYFRRNFQDNVILIDNKKEFAHSIAMALASEGLSVIHVRSNDLLLHMRALASIILFVSTSVDGDALQLMRSLRAQSETAAFIVISSIGSVEYRVSCLKAGADDCIEQPFLMAELLARIQAARRRFAMTQSMRLVSGFLELNRVDRVLYRHGVEVELRPREYKLLEYFMLNEGIALSRDLLIEKIWKDDRAVSANVDVHVGNLRRKIEGGHGRLLASVRGLGFRFGDPVGVLSERYVGRAIGAKIEIGGRFIVSCKITDLTVSNCQLQITECLLLPESLDLLVFVPQGIVQRRKIKVESRDAQLLCGEFVKVTP